MDDEAKVWDKAAKNILAAGQIPFPLSDTFIAFLKEKITLEQARFLGIFRKASMNMEQIREKSKLDDQQIEQFLEELKIRGVITESKSKHSGMIIHTLMPVFPGLVEFSLMNGQKGEPEKRLAILTDKLMQELRDATQNNYDNFMPQLKQYPPIARIVPVEQEINLNPELILQTEEMSALIEMQEYIALTHCYCRQERDLLNHPCKITNRREICLVFGKVAEHAVKYKYARQISKEEAKKLLIQAEDEGLVHKVFHNKLDVSKDIEGICSCCSCCCGIFRFYLDGALPLHTLSSYLAFPDKEACIGCGVCIERCPVSALSLENDKIAVDDTRCIGCGVCTRICPQEPKGIHLKKTGRREIFLLPLKINAK